MNFYRINRGIYKRLHSYFIFLSRNIQYRNKVNKKIKDSFFGFNTSDYPNVEVIDMRE